MDTINPIDNLTEAQGFEQYLIDVSKDVKDKVFHFYMNGIGFCPLGNIQSIKAKAKNGKTQFTKILMAAALSGESMGIECGIDNSSILYVDTEQDPDDSIRVLQGTLTIASRTDSRYKYNEPSDRLNGLALRTVSTDRRWEYIVQAIEHYHPTLVIIDGVRDLIVDFNDLDQSSYIIGELMRMSTEQNCSIVSILHENKNDSNMRGHLGTEMVNKVTDVLETKKETDPFGETYFRVEQIETRNRDIDKFEFIIDDFGVPSLPHLSHVEIDELTATMQHCHQLMWQRHNENPNKYKLKRADFVDIMINEMDIKKSAAYNNFSRAIKQGIISIDKISKQVMLSSQNTDAKISTDFSTDMENSTEAPF